ncbi:MAG: hypothetical protein HY040_14120 [Planctomycetes bacterium]|nr:hypothetical protein [Planctomycetota bacterium]
MSTFYVMPSRPLLGRLFGDFLSSLFPGLDWSTDGPSVRYWQVGWRAAA